MNGCELVNKACCIKCFESSSRVERHYIKTIYQTKEHHHYELCEPGLLVHLCTPVILPLTNYFVVLMEKFRRQLPKWGTKSDKCSC